MNVEKKFYPDGTFYPVIHEYSDLLEFRVNNYEDLWFLSQIKDALGNRRCHLKIPCLIDAQADRRFNPNESHNLRLVCEFINSLGFESVSIFHPHNPEVVEALIDNVVITDNSRLVESVLGRLDAIYGTRRNNLVLMSTDAGGFKPLMKTADKIGWIGKTFSASKSRKYSDGKSTLVQQIDKDDFGGMDILIIDDICVYGGTFIGLYDLLKSRNVGRIHLLVSHLTVKEPKKELEKFDRIFCTNSKYEQSDYSLRNLEVINILNK